MDREYMHCPLCSAFGDGIKFNVSGLWKCLVCSADFSERKLIWKDVVLTPTMLDRLKGKMRDFSGDLDDKLAILETSLNEILTLSGERKRTKRAVSTMQNDFMRRISVSIVVSLIMGVFVNPRLRYILDSTDLPPREWLYVIIPAIIILVVMFFAYPYLEKLIGMFPIIKESITFFFRLLKVFVKKYYKNLVFASVIVLVFIVFVFLRTNDNDPFAHNYIGLTMRSHSPRGYDPVSIDFEYNRGFHWGTQTISFALYRIRQGGEEVRMHSGYMQHRFMSPFRSNGAIVLINRPGNEDYYFQTVNSYRLRITAINGIPQDTFFSFITPTS